MHSLGRAALGVSILPTSSILAWLVRDQSYLRNRFVMRSYGRTPFANESGVQGGKLGSSWDLGIWLGRSRRTNEHLVGTRVGAIKARTVKRRPETLKWDREFYDVMNFVPWLIDGQVTRLEAGWEQHLDAENRSTTPLSETAGASSYSSGGGIIAHSKAVEPDLSDTRGLKREVWMLLTWKSLNSVRSFPMFT